MTYLIIINIISVLVCSFDKWRAIRGGRRVPEKTLFTIVFLGGSVGMYITMRIIRHKTLDKRFMIGIPIIIIFQVLLIYILCQFLNFSL